MPCSGGLSPCDSSAEHASGLPTLVAPDVPMAFTVLALDQWNNVVVNYAGSVQVQATGVSDGDWAGSIWADEINWLSVPHPLDNGRAVFNLALFDAGLQNLTVTGQDDDSNLTGTASLFVQNLEEETESSPGPASHLEITSAASSATAGSAVHCQVTAYDDYGNIAVDSDYVYLTCTDSQSSCLPDGVWLTNGVGAFTATLKTAGQQTITAWVLDADVTSASTDISVTAAAASKLMLAAPAWPGPTRPLMSL